VHWSIERVTAAATFPLRQRVLRPHETTDALSPAGIDGDTVHFAIIEHGSVIGCAMTRPEPPPWSPNDEASWRLRGMATAEDRRREGVGAAVLAAVLDYVKANGGGLVWCSARTPARAFYERAGFLSRGDVWDEPELGPHILMQLELSSPVEIVDDNDRG
jgi:GNAT superfamily N-acetyltransferase